MTRPLRVGGCLPDPEDRRDRTFGLVRASMLAASRAPSSAPFLAILPVTSPISDQGPIGSCVANATADAIELLAGRPEAWTIARSYPEALGYLRDDAPPPVQVSRLDLYWRARRRHGAECEDDGTYNRSAIAAAATGVLLERDWPYDVRNVHVRPPLGALIDAAFRPLTGYYRIMGRGHARGLDVRTAIDAGHPVIFGVDVGDPFVEYDGSGGGVVWNPPARSVGGHAMALVGYRVRGEGEIDYLARNSWGSAWGMREMPGHAWISHQYLSGARDLWVPTSGIEV